MSPVLVGAERNSKNAADDRELSVASITSKISNALKRLDFRPRNFLAQQLSETSVACTMSAAANKFKEALE
jgi:hypothetical protein